MYTKGKWFVTGIIEKPSQASRYILGTSKRALAMAIAYNTEANASRICQCVNSHDELVEAVKMAERARASGQLEKLDKNILQQAIVNAEKEA